MTEICIMAQERVKMVKCQIRMPTSLVAARIVGGSNCHELVAVHRYREC